MCRDRRATRTSQVTQATQATTMAIRHRQSPWADNETTFLEFRRKNALRAPF